MKTHCELPTFIDKQIITTHIKSILLKVASEQVTIAEIETELVSFCLHLFLCNQYEIELEHLHLFTVEVNKMRILQRKYFREKLKTDLHASIICEDRVDKLILKLTPTNQLLLNLNQNQNENEQTINK
jgi:hypothetical protein